MGILDKDARYDAELVDVALKADGTLLELERLPLMLREGDSQAFNLSYSPQVAGQIANNQPMDVNLTRYKVKTQVDWRGGRGQEYSYGETNKFHDATADTRFANQIVLPPGVVSAPLTTANVPDIRATSAVTAQLCNAKWVARANTKQQVIFSGIGYGQKFVASASTTVTELKLYLNASLGTTLSINIFSDNAGLPNAALFTQSITTDDLSPYVATSFSLGAGYALTSGTTYHLVILGTGYNFTLQHTQSEGTGGESYSSNAGASWSAYGNSGYGIFFEFTGNSYFKANRKVITDVGLGSSTAITNTFTYLNVYCKLNQWTNPNGTASLLLCGRKLNESPNTSDVTQVLTAAMFSGVVGAAGWVKLTIPSFALAAQTWTWRIQGTTTNETDNIEIEVYSISAAANYLTWARTTSDATVSAWASTASTGLVFYWGDGQAIVAAPTCRPQLFKSKWYVAAGTALIRWNTGTLTWDTVFTSASTITALAEFAGSIYVAQGDANDIQASTTGDSGTYASASAGKQYTYLKKYNGYLYIAKSVAGANSFGYTDGTAWNVQTLATSDHNITGLEGYANEIVIATDRGLFALGGSLVYQFYDYSHEVQATNGKHLTAWLGDGQLYIPIRNSLNADNGQRKMKPTGPEEAEQLPAGEQGNISCMVGESAWLFASIDAGTTGTSSIYAFNGTGWHCLYKSSAAGRRIQAIGMEASTTDANGNKQPRLWFFEGTTAYYMTIPSLTDNPYLSSNILYQQSGYVISSWLLGEYSQVVKDFRSIKLWCDGVSATQRIRVQFQVDRAIDSTGAPLWIEAGVVTNPADAEVFLTVPTGNVFVSKTTLNISTRTTIYPVNAEMSGISAGCFVRVGETVCQVTTVGTDNFTIAVPLASPPDAGTIIAASTPAGKEIRVRLVLQTDDTTKSPRVRRLSVRFQEQLIEVARLGVNIRAEDQMKDRNGGGYPYSASVLRNKTLQWARRATPYVLLGPDNQKFLVKPTGISYGAPSRESTLMDPTIKSAISMSWDQAGNYPRAKSLYSDLIIPTAGLFGYWQLDDAVGTTRPVDSSGNGRTGSAGTNGMAFGGPSGVLSSTGSVVVNGPAASMPILPILANYTIPLYTGSTFEFWFNQSATDAVGHYVMFDTNNGGNSMFYTHSTGVWNFANWMVNLGPWTGATATKQLALGVWHHIVLTSSLSVSTVTNFFYVNGVSIAVAPGSIPGITSAGPSSAIRLGFLLKVQCSFDEFAIYSRALSASEVLAHYNRGIGLS